MRTESILHPGAGWARRAAKIIAFAAGLAALLSLQVLPAYADNNDVSNDRGDSQQSCGSGEICFKRDKGGPDLYLRHYWYTDHDHNDGEDAWYWSDGGGQHMDAVSSWLNRDTACDVVIWDIDKYGNWYVYFNMPHNSSDTVYDWIGDNLNDRNNGHERCTDGRHG